MTSFTFVPLPNSKLTAYPISHCDLSSEMPRGSRANKQQEPLKHFPKLFGPLRDRYLSRPGGYTRLLLSESHKSDQARSAMLTLVDGPKDIRFAMTAKEILRHRREGKEMWNEATAMHVRKVTRYRENGEELLEEEIARLEKAEEQVKRQEKEEYEREGTTFEWKEKLGPGTYERKKTKADAINYREKLERSQRQRGRSV